MRPPSPLPSPSACPPSRPPSSPPRRVRLVGRWCKSGCCWDLSGNEDGLDWKSIEHVEEAADVVGIRVAQHDAVQRVYAPAAQEIHHVGSFLQPPRVDKVALPRGLYEHPVPLPDVYKAHGQEPEGGGP